MAEEQQPTDADDDAADNANASASAAEDDAEESEENETEPVDADESASIDDGANESESDAEDLNESDSDARDENASEAPPVDMPEQAPEHVVEIHQLIRDKLAGELGNVSLGEAISSVVGGNGDAAADRSEAVDENASQPSEDSRTAAADNRADNAAENADQADDASQVGSSNAGLVGDLPEQAADHVSAIHDAIVSFLEGDGDTPGDAVSGISS